MYWGLLLVMVRDEPWPGIVLVEWTSWSAFSQWSAQVTAGSVQAAFTAHPSLESCCSVILSPAVTFHWRPSLVGAPASSVTKISIVTFLTTTLQVALYFWPVWSVEIWLPLIRPVSPPRERHVFLCAVHVVWDMFLRPVRGAHTPVDTWWGFRHAWPTALHIGLGSERAHRFTVWRVGHTGTAKLHRTPHSQRGSGVHGQETPTDHSRAA